MIFGIIAAVVILAVFAVYHFGFIDFYHPMRKPREGQIRVACVGDSITFGCTVRNWRKNNYPNRLADMLGDGYCVNNFGYTNRTVINSADYPYTKEKLYRQSLDFQPDIVVLLLGSNDSKKCNWDEEKFINDYGALVKSYQAVGAKVYVLIPPPLFPVRGKVMWQLRQDVLEDAICPTVVEIAEKTGAACVDMHSVFAGKKELFSDGVHPNARGSKLFAQTIFERIFAAGCD